MRISVNPPHPPNPRSVLLAILLALITFGQATAADSTRVHRNVIETIGDDIVTVWGDVGPFFTRPVHFDGSDWRNAAIVVGATGVLMPLDSSGRRAALTSSQSTTMQDFMNLSTHFGDAYIIGGAVGVTYLGGLAFGSDALRTTGRELIETLALAGATTTILKYAIGRSRPFTGDGPFGFHPFSFSDIHTSLPSGHTTVAFSIASVLAARIDHPVATVLLYGAATCTAFSRMYHDKHWLSDTFLGAAIATTTGLWVVKQDERREGKAKDSGLLISPGVSGVSLTYRF